ncbi:MAG: hypothetical protein JAY97_16185 [Candidatus Thiodiazotropha sp. 'RUGA']|nr:hypothetical protein [Candidatus Thiodiazotropha sp. 'RUGA']
MSNWFEENATRSVIVHTLVVAAATWAAFAFIFDENKVQLHEAKVSRVEAAAKEVSARNSVLITRVEYLTKENEKLTRWLESTPKSIPHYENEINNLKERIIELEKVAANVSNANVTETSDHPDFYQLMKNLKSGTSFVDPKTKAVLGVRDIDIDKTAFVNISLPSGKKIKAEKVSPGETWGFEDAGKEYQLVLDSIDWPSQSYKASIMELPAQETLNK